MKQIHRVRRWLLAAGVITFLLWLPHPLAAQGSDPTAAGQTKIAQLLRAELAAAPADVSFLVILDEQLDPAATVQTAGLTAADALTRRAALYAALTAHAQRTQAPLRAWLEARGIDYQAHYLVNMLEVRGDLALAQALAQQPGVARLVRNPQVSGLQGVTAAPRFAWRTLAELPNQTRVAALPWGLTYTNADDVWALGFRGQNIIVAGQDTGVNWDHPALLPAYRGWDTVAMTATHAYNWFDAWGRDPALDPACPSDAQVPCDDNGHGTHTLGTVAGDATPMGDTVIGMAPDAAWIACRNMRDGDGTPASYTSCFEFFLAPYPQGGDPLTKAAGTGAACDQQFVGLPASRRLRRRQPAPGGGNDARRWHLCRSVGGQRRAWLRHCQQPDRDTRRCHQCGGARQQRRHRRLQQPRPGDDRWQRTPEA
jgi:serine protease AprX